MTDTTPLDTSYLKEALEEVRRRLLDQTGRSRLLHYREMARDIPIIDEMPNQVYEHLVVDGQGFLFDPLSEEPGEGEAPSRDLPRLSSSSDVDDRYRDNRLQTPFTRRELDRRLLRLYREHRTIIEETGANNLYLALGFLRWIDDKHEDESRPRLAPLMLVPVRIEREGRAGATRFSLHFEDEALDTNYSLSERLRNPFQFNLPLLEEETPPEEYWQQVEAALTTVAHRGWEVVRQMTLGLFSFQKQVMWHDLDPERWPRHSPLQDKSLIQRVLTGAPEGGDGPGALGHTFDIDDPSQPPAQLRLIRDADSSQHTALVDSLEHGEGLVIEGPPGTGKSQTITNLIAAAIGRGETVLFVAEKMAALEVVYRRLEEAGLGQFCLQLHGLRTSKKELMESLRSRLDYVAPSAASVHQQRNDLALAKSQLLSTSKAHCKNVGPRLLGALGPLE